MQYNLDNIDNIDKLDNIDLLKMFGGTTDKIEENTLLYNSHNGKELNINYINRQIDSIIEQIKEFGNGKEIWKYFINYVEKSGKQIEFSKDELRGTDEHEKKRATNAILTDIVVNHIVSEESKRNMIIDFTIRMFSGVLKKYCQLVGIESNKVEFIYKGGNVLREIFNKSMKEIKPDIAKPYKKELDSYFKISDNDYSVEIDNNVHNGVFDNNGNPMTYDDIFRNLTCVCHFVLSVIRRNIASEKNLYGFYDYYGLTYEAKKQKIEPQIKTLEEELLKTYNSKLLSITHGIGICKENINGLECSKNADVFYYNGYDGLKEVELKMNDVFVINDGNEKNPDTDKNKVFTIEQLGMPTSTFPVRLSTNTGIKIVKFDTNKNETLVRFNLTRTKFTFTLKIQNITTDVISTLNTTGEMIDVSLQYKNGLKYEVLQDYEYGDGQVYKSYNYDYYILDLFRVLFMESQYPWFDIKYKKRLTRIVFLYCFSFKHYLYSSYDTKNRLDEIIKFMTLLKNTLPKNSSQIYQTIYSYFDSNKIKKEIKFKELFEVMEATSKTIQDTDNETIKLYREFWETSIGVVEKLCKMFSEFAKELEKTEGTCSEPQKTKQIFLN